MPIKYANTSGAIVDDNAPAPKFPIYFCEHCGFQGAAFHVKQGDRVLSYCGWNAGRPVCIDKGKSSVSIVG